jgi:hypothetical protein
MTSWGFDVLPGRRVTELLALKIRNSQMRHSQIRHSREGGNPVRCCEKKVAVGRGLAACGRQKSGRIGL